MRLLAFKLVSDETMSMAVAVWVVLEDLMVGCITDRRKIMLCLTAVVLSETPAMTWWRSDQRERGCMTGLGPVTGDRYATDRAFATSERPREAHLRMA